MRPGGAMVIHDCSFISNTASTRGLAVAVVGSANISGSSFDGNELICPVGSYRLDTEEVNGGRHNSRYIWRRMLSLRRLRVWEHRDTCLLTL